MRGLRFGFAWRLKGASYTRPEWYVRSKCCARLESHARMEGYAKAAESRRMDVDQITQVENCYRDGTATEDADAEEFAEDAAESGEGENALLILSIRFGSSVASR